MIKKDLCRGQWDQGQLIAYSALDGVTDYDGGLVARTVNRPPGIEIRDPGKILIRFKNAPTGEIVFGGDHFSCDGMRGVVVDAHHLLIEGDCAVEGSDEKIRFLAKGGRILVGSGAVFDEPLVDSDIEKLIEQRSQWLMGCKIPEELNSISRRTIGRALTMMKSQVYSPAGVLKHRWTTPDRWPHKDMWLWDSAFHAIGWRHVDLALAREIIEGMFDLQRADGFLTYRGTPSGPYFHLGDLVTQPPVLAHAVQLVDQVSPDRRWLERMYPRLAAYVKWDLKNRDTDGGGLLEWFIEDDENCRSGESGMDNSPRFDSARRLDAVDFNAFVARECEVLGQMAESLGRREEAELWAGRHGDLCQLIGQKFWSEKSGFYFDNDPVKGEQSGVWASSGFLPLICGAASVEQAASLGRHLRDPDLFGTVVPLPSVAVADTASYAKDMWRGPMWVNINWVVAAGFERYGMVAEAALIRERTAAEIERTCEKFGTFFEYFDDRREVDPPDLLRKGENCPEQNPYRQVIHDFGWTATLYVDLIWSGKREAIA